MDTAIYSLYFFFQINIFVSLKGLEVGWAENVIHH